VLLSDYVKKKSKFFFYSDRLLNVFDNGELRYYNSKNGALREVIEPGVILAVDREGKDCLRVATQRKAYLFKFASPRKADDFA